MQILQHCKYRSYLRSFFAIFSLNKEKGLRFCGTCCTFCFLACSNFRLLFSRCVSSSRPPESQRFFVTDFLTQERWELDNVSLVLFFFYFASLSANVLLLSSSYLGMELLLNYSNTLGCHRL